MRASEHDGCGDELCRVVSSPDTMLVHGDGNRLLVRVPNGGISLTRAQARRLAAALTRWADGGGRG